MARGVVLSSLSSVNEVEFRISVSMVNDKSGERDDCPCAESPIEYAPSNDDSLDRERGGHLFVKSTFADRRSGILILADISVR